MNCKRTALTLVEVTIVILILGILAAVSIPRLSGSLQAARLSFAASALQVHLAHARSVAITSGRVVTVTFDNSSDSYASADVGFPDQPGSTLDVNVRSMFDPSIDLQANFDAGNTISFDIEGAPRVAGVPLNVGFVDLSVGEMSQRVRVHSGLGYVSGATESEIP